MVFIIIILLTLVQARFSRTSRLRDYQLSSIESGFEALKFRVYYSSSFFMLAVLFVLFDLELVLVLPLIFVSGPLQVARFFLILIVVVFMVITLL
jgi:NADH-ubiquinone oxidoreductase chain 3